MMPGMAMWHMLVSHVHSALLLVRGSSGVVPVIPWMWDALS
jgi:hypothetical protein